MKTSDYKNLNVWSKAMDLAVQIYDSTRCFPDEEKFGLISQMRRAGVSIPSNIAEGHARMSNREFVHFLKFTLGSNAELETQIILSYRLGFLDKEEQDKLLLETKNISKMTIGLIRRIESNMRYSHQQKNNNNNNNTNNNNNKIITTTTNTISISNGKH